MKLFDVSLWVVFTYSVNVLLQASLRITWYATQIKWRHSR